MAKINAQIDIGLQPNGLIVSAQLLKIQCSHYTMYYCKTVAIRLFVLNYALHTDFCDD